MDNEKLLLQIKQDLIKKIEQSIISYIEAYVNNNTSHENYVYQAQHEAKWLMLKNLLKLHFPDVNIHEIQENAKQKAFQILVDSEDLSEDLSEEIVEEISEHSFFHKD